MGVFHFDPEEMEGICPLSAQKDYLKKFGYDPPPLRVGFAHQESSSAVSEMKVDAPVRANSVGHHSNGVNTLIAKRNTKKRVPLVGGMPAPLQPTKIQPPPTATSRLNPPSISAGITSYSFDDPADSSRAQIDQLISASSSRSPTVSAWNRNARHPSDHFAGNDDVEMLDAHSDVSVQISSLNDDETPGARGKRKISDLIDDGRPVKARTLGGDQGRRERPVVREIASGSNVGQGFAQSSDSVLLTTPPLLNFITAKVDGTQDVLECLNKVDEGKKGWHRTHALLLTNIRRVTRIDIQNWCNATNAVAGFLTVPCDWGNRHEEVLRRRDAGRLYQRIYSNGSEV